MKRVKNSKDMIKELKKGNDVWFDERMTELTTNVDRYKLGYLKALEQVEKMIEKQPIIIMTDFDGKHNLIDLNKLMNNFKKLEEKKEK